MLRICLEALLKQTRRPIEICVGRRENDAESAAVLADFAHRSEGLVREAVVGPEGNLVASMNAALALTTGDLVALTDDDAEAPPDWLEKLVPPFADPTIGGVGGKDIQRWRTGKARVVGRLLQSGRLVGNHHLGVGPARNVEVLKGVNCCFRGDLIRQIGFDTRLRGPGNVTNWELCLCFEVLSRGYSLIYNPSITVTHHVGPRHDGDVNHRGGFDPRTFAFEQYNETLAVKLHPSRLRRLSYFTRTLLIGSRRAPGLAALIGEIPRQGLIRPLRRYAACMAGRLPALLSGRKVIDNPKSVCYQEDLKQPEALGPFN